MHKILFFIAFTLITLFTSNCGTVLNAYAPTRGVHGADHGGIIFSKTVRSEEIPKELGSKSGRACQTMVALLAAFGDASLPEAMKQGNISTVKHITYEKTRGVLFLYMQDCIVVYGD